MGLTIACRLQNVDGVQARWAREFKSDPNRIRRAIGLYSVVELNDQAVCSSTHGELESFGIAGAAYSLSADALDAHFFAIVIRSQD